MFGAKRIVLLFGLLSACVVCSFADDKILHIESLNITARFQNFSALTQYWDAFSRPSLYLSDYYGLYAVYPQAKEKVRGDFAKFATFTEETNHTLTLHFKTGRDIVFHHDQILTIKNATMETRFDYFWFEGNTVEDLISDIRFFQSVILKENLQTSYFIPNVNYQLELQIWQRISNGTALVHPVLDTSLRLFSSSNPSVLLFPDYVHGNIPRYNQLVSVFKDVPPFDWFAIEMFPRQVQSSLDEFVFGEESTPQWQTARQVLINTAWKGKFPDEDPNHPENNRYFKLIELCRAIKIKAIGMENSDPTYDLWGHGETPFGANVRNFLWTETLETTGRGLIFGGSAHFSSSSPANVQDFFHDKSHTLLLSFEHL